MWQSPRTTKLLSIFMDLREFAATLPPKENCPGVLALYIATQLRDLGYPLRDSLMYHCVRVGNDVDPERVIAKSKQQHYLTTEVFEIVSRALREASYNGEELIVSMHGPSCAVISFKPPTGALTRW